MFAVQNAQVDGKELAEIGVVRQNDQRVIARDWLGSERGYIEILRKSAVAEHSRHLGAAEPGVGNQQVGFVGMVVFPYEAATRREQRLLYALIWFQCCHHAVPNK